MWGQMRSLCIGDVKLCGVVKNMWGLMRSLCIGDVNICGEVKNLWGRKKYVGTNE